ncbi:MAG: hypothetical protein QM784_32225 [Polyangiaceae bacterium]
MQLTLRAKDSELDVIPSGGIKSRMERVRYDDSRWPIVQVTTPTHVMTEEEFERHLDELTAFHERGEFFGFLFDVRQSPAPTAEQRRKVAERIERDLKLYGRVCPCAVVVANSLQIGVIKVILWLLRSVSPRGLFEYRRG